MNHVARERRTPRRMMAILATLGLIAGVLAIAPAAGAGVTKCQGANLTQGTKESPNLATLIAAANAGDKIQVKGVCVGNFVIEKSLTLVGKATKEVPTPTLDGNATGTVVFVTNSAAVSISKLTITNGKRLCPSDLSDRYCDVGGVTADDTGTALTITGSTVTRNEGSGVAAYGSLTITASTITDNVAALAVGGVFAGGPAIITNSTISNNTATTGTGGGLAAQGSLTLTGSTISDNSAARNAGGVAMTLGSAVISGSTIRDNAAGLGFVTGRGGGIYVNGGSVVLVSSTVTGNSALLGGGVAVFGLGSFTDTDPSGVTNNTAPTCNNIYPTAC